MRYFFLDTLASDDPKHYFIDKRPKGLGLKSWRMAKGATVQAEWPPEAPPVFPSDDCLGVKLTSRVGTTLGYLIVCSDLRDVIREHCQTTRVEYLPLILYSKKKRVQSRDYCIVNPLGTIDCLDRERSHIAYTPEGEVIDVKKAVLDPKKLEDVPALFRIKEIPREYVINEPLARAIAARSFTNIFVQEIELSPQEKGKA
jgi:hypothetical protein